MPHLLLKKLLLAWIQYISQKLILYQDKIEIEQEIAIEIERI